MLGAYRLGESNEEDLKLSRMMCPAFASRFYAAAHNDNDIHNTNSSLVIVSIINCAVLSIYCSSKSLQLLNNSSGIFYSGCFSSKIASNGLAFRNCLVTV